MPSRLTVIRTISDKIGEQLTTHLRAIADANPLLKGIIDRLAIAIASAASALREQNWGE
jgi:hypothetical protein